MATFRKRGSKWQVQVRRIGHPLISRSFSKKADADTWAREAETAIDRGQQPTATKELRTVTLADLMVRYRDTVTAKKRGREVETLRLNKLLEHPVSRYALAHVTPAMIARYRDGRLCFVQPETVRRELTILRHIFEVARRDWGYRVPINPVAEIKKPSPANARERRLTGDEQKRLLEGARKSRSKFLEPAVQLAIETGMRRGELLALHWRQIDLEARKVHIPNTKTGVARTIPMSTRAVEILTGLPRTGEAVFLCSANALRLAWERLTKRVAIADLHFHDLRHEAISRFFERGLSVPEVALISGHRDVRQLFRYIHLRPEDVAAKLA